MSQAEPVTATRLQEVLTSEFEEPELEALLSALGASYDDLPGQEKADKVEALVSYFARRRRLPELVANAKRLHPDASWGHPEGGSAEGPRGADNPASDRLLALRPRRRPALAIGCAFVLLAAIALGLAFGGRLPWLVLARPTLVPTEASTVAAPALTFPPTATRSGLVALPSTATPTFTPSPTPPPTQSAPSTPTEAPSATATFEVTNTPVPTLTATATSAPVRTRTPTSTVTPTLPPTTEASPTVLPPAPPTSTPTPLPAPVLVEPEAGASFTDDARLKFSWYRRLEPDERFSIQIQAVGHPPEYDWWPSERDILEGGGAIHTVEGGYLYEVNVRLRPVSLGEAHWKVAVMGEQGTERWQVSPWSAERQIYRVPWPGRSLG